MHDSTYTATQYRGVKALTLIQGGKKILKYSATVYYQDTANKISKHIKCGMYTTAKEAAIERDRWYLRVYGHHDANAKALNFPDRLEQYRSDATYRANYRRERNGETACGA